VAIAPSLSVKPVNVEKWLVEALTSKLSLVFNLRVRVESGLSLSDLLDFYDESRDQVKADLLLEYLSQVLATQALCLVLVDADAYVEGLNFVFGVAKWGWGGIVFVARLKPEFYGMSPNYSLLTLRLIKESFHELGHALGLGHCGNSRCVMRFSNSIYDVDSKSPYYCPRCRREIELRYPGVLRIM